MYLHNLLTLALIVTTGSDYVIKNRGDIYFIYNELTIRDTINIQKYYSNTNEYIHAHEAYAEICKTMEELLGDGERCTYALQKQNKTLMQMLDDIEYINTYKNRNKRSTNSVYKSNYINDILDGNFKDVFNFLKQQYKGVVGAPGNEIMENLTKRMIALEKEHTDNTNSILNILEKDKTTIMRKINRNKIISLIAKHSKNISSKYKVPELDIRNLFTISTMESNVNDTEITITLTIPIIGKKCETLYEIIPVPVNANNSTIILNRNSVYYLMDANITEKIKIITNSHLKSCKHLNRKTFCNSLVTTAMYEGDECWNSIVYHSNATICPYRKIAHANYFIPLGEDGTFLYVIEPTSVRMTCNNKTTFHNITDHKIITYNNNCNVYKALDFDPSTYYEQTQQMLNTHFSTNQGNNS